MRIHDFIFSNQLSYRISRHLTFWMFWLLLCYSTHWLPNFSRLFAPFFSHWNTSELLSRIDKGGGWYRALITPFIDSWYKGFIGQMVFTYSIAYFTLPRCLSKKKSNQFTILFTLLFIAGFLAYQYFSIYLNYLGAVKRGDRPFVPEATYILTVTIKTMAVTLPTIVGMAVAIKLLKRWWLKVQETEQRAREKARAELRLLKAQIHPHFLFNTLNNIYFYTLSASRQAPEMIKKLSDMLQYILNECDRPLVPLEKELKMIQDYMALEKIRYGEQMELTVGIKGSYHNRFISPLLLIPFIENSFKHGASKMLSHAYIKLNITIEENTLSFLLTNSKPNMPMPKNKNGSIGLKNVRKRLQLLYPGTHELNIVGDESTFIVFMKIQLEEINQDRDYQEIQKRRHEMA